MSRKVCPIREQTHEQRCTSHLMERLVMMLVTNGGKDIDPEIKEFMVEKGCSLMPTEKHQSCLEEKCALYDPSSKECGVLAVSKGLGVLHGVTENIAHIMQHGEL